MDYKGRQTGAIAGFFDILFKARETLGTEGVVFCLDSRVNKRKEVYQPYKATRSPTEPALRQQMEEIGGKILLNMGFSNVLIQTGYEADDLIAAVTFSATKRAIILSSDKDLRQCLREGVSQYDPGTKRLITEKTFADEYGIPPSDWATVKAISGDDGDNVRGVEGVGEKGAISYVTNQMPMNGKKATTIKAAKQVIERNLQLVTLPYPGVDVPLLYEDEDTPTRIKLVLAKYGINRR
jgi:DNA polymerase-1